MENALLQWAPAVIVILLGLAFCVRRFRGDLGTLEKFRGRHLEHIQAQEQQIQEDRKNISRSEHLGLAQAALADLLRLEGNRPGFRLDVRDSSLLLHTTEGVWRITLNMRERTLRHRRRVLHGTASWLLEGPEYGEEYADLAELMRNLTARLRGEEAGGAMPQIPSRRAASGRRNRLP
jgi:hypothetical protein